MGIGGSRRHGRDCYYQRTEQGVWQALRSQPALARNWARRYLRTCVRQRGAIQPRRKDEFLAMQAARDMGAIFCHQHRQDAPSQELFQCTVCDQAFTSEAAQAAHMSKVHAPAAATRAARGTSCAVCMTEYWTAARLRLHLRKHPKCLHVIEAAAKSGCQRFP